MNNLFLDVGNTAVKWLFDGEYSSALAKGFDIAQLPQAEKVFVSCVGDKSILDGLANAVFVGSKPSLNNFQNAYKNSNELGVDRFLAILGGMSKHPSQNLLIVDIGSALTFDVVLADGKHQGGLIMPGISALRNSFDNFSTSCIKLKPGNIADNTKDAWSFGTTQMLINSIDRQIDIYLESYNDLTIMLTGGDADNIAPILSHKVELHKNLVLDALEQYSGII